MNDERLSLYHIEQGLAELMDAREEAEAELKAAIVEGCNGQEDMSCQAALAAVDQALREYAAREVAKVDGIRGYIRWAKVQIAEANRESEAQKERARVLEAGLERLKAFVVDVMDTAGKKKIEGNTGALMVKGNGGAQPLVISDESLIPNELCWMEGRIRGDVWMGLLGLMIHTGSKFRDGDFDLKRVPSNTLIREALTKDCPRCDGHGKYCDECGGTDCRCERVDMKPCPGCGGSGKAGVPGASLGERGKHLECK